MTRLVIDASVWLPGIVGAEGSPPARLFDAAMEGEFESVVCPRLLGEIRRGLDRPYFRDRISPQEADRILRAITQASIQLRDPRDPPSVPRDPNDDYLVPLATTARARAIVTGDKDLLDHPGLHPPALTPRAACELLHL